MRMFKDIHPRWQQQAKRSSQPLIILSPYITQDVALSLVKGKTGARIYTLFDTNVFATGGSDLEDIVELMQKHEVYQLDGLHAKLVTDKDTFVTVGSQNLTRGGKHNLELSVHLNDEPARRQAMDIVEPWLDDAERITPEMVADMKVDIERLKGLYKEFQKQCAEHQKDFVCCR
ncbi:phospholipase D-like domain-containing protein [Pseudomonas sp. HTZ1]|uniref:phospholipase D-like domain-containing protein n=1 Tax=Pseudomonas sp. HTZ1 TaxID=3075219 RepID=UPI00287D744E|nr:phospholipase D-like domain-containing protein [Pseudomonas sp. HTZ1]MDS9592667.1 phospholipase D-like domain-containing protein [Pseudomonas sp. HTZ1]